MASLERLFHLTENGTTVRTEMIAGVTTFLTMAYIIFVQPAVLSGTLFGIKTGMDFGAVMTATCVSDATGTVIGACCGTSTVTSFIESVAGVEQGGRTGYPLADGRGLRHPADVFCDDPELSAHHFRAIFISRMLASFSRR